MFDAGDARPPCEHLILLASGEVAPSDLVTDVPSTPEALLTPPDAEWFEAALDANLTSFAQYHGLRQDPTLELSADRWTDDMLEWICEPRTRPYRPVERISQLGLRTTWVRNPDDYWEDVVSIIDELRESVKPSRFIVGWALWGMQLTVAQNLPPDLPDGLRDSLGAFFGDRKELTPGMREWLEARVGEPATNRLEQTTEGAWFWDEDAASPVNVLVGQVVLRPALDSMDDGDWWFEGDGPPDGFGDGPGPSSEWGWPIAVKERSLLAEAEAPHIAALARLAADLVAVDWSPCDECGGLRRGEDGPCLDGCPSPLGD